MSKEKAECPDIEQDDGYEKVLAWSEAVVEYEPALPWPAWGFRWQYGFITFTSLSKPEDEAAARKATAMTIYLWCKGVPMSLANKLGLCSACPSYFDL